LHHQRCTDGLAPARLDGRGRVALVLQQAFVDGGQSDILQNLEARLIGLAAQLN
jgi:hypothetical protein